MQNLKNICQFQDHIITSKINNTFLWNKWFLCFYQKDLIAKCQEKMMKISLFFLLFFFGIFIHWNSLDYHVIYRMFYKRGNSKTLPRTDDEFEKHICLEKRMGNVHSVNQLFNSTSFNFSFFSSIFFRIFWKIF